MGISNIKSTSVASLNANTVCFQSLTINWSRDTERYSCHSLDSELVFGGSAQVTGSFTGNGLDFATDEPFTDFTDAEGALSIVLDTVSGRRITFANATSYATNISMNADQKEHPTFDVSWKASGVVTAVYAATPA